MGLPEPRTLGHGFHVVSVPLPFRSPAWVNCYLIEGDELFLIDCGVDWDEGLDVLRTGVESLGIEPGAISKLVVSHLHPDHVGMAPRISDLWGCRIIMHETAATRIDRYNDTDAFAARIRSLAVTHGVPAEVRPDFIDVGRRAPFMPFMRQPDDLVADGDEIAIADGRWLEVLHTPGHEASHICLRDSRTGIVFSGDHVLPRITPVIMIDDDGVDVLGLYLESLQRLVDLGIGLTYPAHGGIVDHGGRRAEQIALHHDRRLAGMLETISRSPRTGWEVMLESYRPNLSVSDQRLALRETISHLEHLRSTSEATRFAEDDLWFYRGAPR